MIGRNFDDEGRLIVKASHRNPVDIADEVAAHILENNDPPRLFSMSPAAVTLKNGALTPLDTDGWLLYVARRVTFIVPSRNGTQMVAPPAAVMKLIPARGDPRAARAGRHRHHALPGPGRQRRSR